MAGLIAGSSVRLFLAYSTGVTNNYKKATIDVVKIDQYSKDKKLHGDARLDGAEFQLYEDVSCTSRATVYNSGESSAG